ncbi:transposase [Pseudomonadota bacterium]
MTNYRRSQIKGATYFFTVNCAKRHGDQLLIDHLDLLRKAFRKVKNEHPFKIDAIVILPDHVHCIWSLPQGDADYKIRWALIKAGFSRDIPHGENRSHSRVKRGERGIWQRRYWEHKIRDVLDYQRHVDYIHWNPVKHGWVNQVADWPHSSFHVYVRRGILRKDWAGEPDEVFRTGEFQDSS